MNIDKFDGIYGFLSNFYYKELYFEGKKYKTSEHAFQAAKATNEAEQNKIRFADTPAQAKHLGRVLKSIRKDWDFVKFDTMLNILRAKFSDSELAKRLLETGDLELIEGNMWHDNIWGSCVCQKCGNKGKNNLGRLLVQVRDELKNRKDNTNETSATS